MSVGTSGSAFNLTNAGLIEENILGPGTTMGFGSAVTVTNNSGVVQVDASCGITMANAYTQNGGLTQIDGSFSSPTSIVFGGTFDGTGTVTGNVDNFGGIVHAGDSPGTLTIDGNYIQMAGGELKIEISSAREAGLLDVLGMASLDGTLDVSLLGFTPMLGDSWTFLTARSISGDFASFIFPRLGRGLAFAETLGSTSISLSVVQVSGTPEPSSIALMLIGAIMMGGLAYRRERYRA